MEENACATEGAEAVCEVEPAADLLDAAWDGSSVNWALLVDHATSVQASARLDDVHHIFAQCERAYLAVLDGSRAIGLCSRSELGTLLGSRYGFSLFGKDPAGAHVVRHPVFVHPGDAATEVLDRLFRRASEDFDEDVLLSTADGHLLGLIAVRTLVGLQTRMLAHKIRALEEQRLALQRSRDQLRTAHEDLRAVQLALIDAEKLKSVGRLAAGVAHEVRNPLAITRMGIDFLSMESFSEESGAPVILEEIRIALARADTVVNSLLDFSTPKPLEIAHHDMNAVIKDSLALIEAHAAGLNIGVESDLEVDLPEIPLDRKKAGQLFVHLFTNAVQAMNGPGTLRIRTRSRQLNGVGPNISDSRSESFRVGDLVVVAEVFDTGPGIPGDKLGKVFEPFFTTKPTGKGTGLGLAVCKTIVDLHGGTIQIDNCPEGGLLVTMMFKTL